MGFFDRLQHGWNAFVNNRDPTHYNDYGYGYSSRPDRPILTRGKEKSIVASICNRIALDASSVKIRHCRLDSNDRYLEDVKSHLNECLSLAANIDQTSRAFIQDAVLSMLDEGCVAIVPVDTDLDPKVTNSYDILSMRTAEIVEWFPSHVKVRIYNDRTGKKENIILPKKMVAIVENPLRSVMNEPNSTMQRLSRKLSLVDMTDENTASGKLDLIIQLPYLVKTDARKQQAEARRKDIEMQLAGSKYGIAYTDGSEKVTQLNRPIENNLQQQVEYLTNLLFSQIGMTQAVLDGTADEKAMLNYQSRIIEPILSAIADEMKRKFLTKTARSQGQSIEFFNDPFKLVPVNNIADIADKFTRNEILTSNEIRQIIGMKPSSDPKADQLINSNLNHPDGEANEDSAYDETMPDEDPNMIDDTSTMEEQNTQSQEEGIGNISVSDIM